MVFHYHYKNIKSNTHCFKSGRWSREYPFIINIGISRSFSAILILLYSPCRWNDVESKWASKVSILIVKITFPEERQKMNIIDELDDFINQTTETKEITRA